MPTLAIDLDGTLVTWVGGKETQLGEWLPGAQQALRILNRETEIIIHSCRFTWEAAGGWEQFADLAAAAGFRPFLADFDSPAGRYRYRAIPQSAVADGARLGLWVGKGKPVAVAYIDDRGLHFESWPQMFVLLGIADDLAEASKALGLAA